ncbi:putative Ninja family, Jas TPL-binding domain-containing protein [Helianthus annuus]|nr:putative Ninja family, Jas TPL-binding domain-containing protein [Helianthus annuus]KAJ0770520.1 putative Ninja family, Jas TPL-binding domain-containing protein [Helianthus annuus]
MNVNKKNCVLGVVATDDSKSNSSNSQLDQQLASADQPTGSSKQTSTRYKEASDLARMPCVSTTGNGPNGRTVSGFLYRYTKNEVSIVCACHGESFTPAGFVEHAGGIDIAHPLKHITIFPTAFAS